MSRSYTSARREHLGQKPQFTLDDVEFTADGNISALDMSDMAMRFANIKIDGMAAATAFAEFYQAALGPECYRRFLAHTRAHHTDRQTLFDVMGGLVEDFTGRPTVPPSLSQPGRSTTGTNSMAGSSRRARRRRGGERQQPQQPQTFAGRVIPGSSLQGLSLPGSST